MTCPNCTPGVYCPVCHGTGKPGARVAALEAENAALREMLGKVKAWATSAATNDGAMMSIRESIHVASAGKEVLAILDGGK